MVNPFILKLAHGAELTDGDKQVLEQAIAGTRQLGPREDLIREGDQPDNVHLIVEGFACRYKLLPDGGRQIMAYLVPGDICDLHVAILGEMDHAIGSLSACKVAELPRQTIEELTSKHVRITRALWWATLVDEATLREWITNLGRRPADKRLAHLFCELLIRLQSVGLASENSYEFPVTQGELADTLGLTPVHVNRTLQELRSNDLIAFNGKELTIKDVGRLKAFADFDPNYLHLKKRERNAEGQSEAVA